MFIFTKQITFVLYSLHKCVLDVLDTHKINVFISSFLFYYVPHKCISQTETI